MRNESGQDHWVSANAAPIRDAAGSIVAGIVIFLDMTERRRAEMAAEAERERLFAVLQRMPGLVYLQRRDHTIAFANERLKKIVGEPGTPSVLRGLLGTRQTVRTVPHVPRLRDRPPGTLGIDQLGRKHLFRLRRTVRRRWRRRANGP